MHPFNYPLWQTKNITKTLPCMQNMHVDIAIIGGGIAGLHGAKQALKIGKKIALFEKNLCGSGATGKSSGFVTPNAELSFSDFSKRFNPEIAHQIWQCIVDGMRDMATTIKNNNFFCDFAEQETCIVASSSRSLKELAAEHENLVKIGYQTFIHDQTATKNLINSNRFYGSIVYPESFSLNPFAYCQELKKYLIYQGVCIFEETPVTHVNDHILQTTHAQITADTIIICVDKDLPALHKLEQDVYHAQSFVLVSQPLTEQQIQSIFPAKQYLCWDTALIYNYFRITADNRLLLGGGNLFSTYAKNEMHDYAGITKKLTNYFHKTFQPNFEIEWQFQWPGLIGISKDIAPIIGRDTNFPHIFYVTACTGLPIAAAFGSYAVQHLFENRTDLDDYFSPYRSFPISGLLQNIIGTPLTFMICNGIKSNIP